MATWRAENQRLAIDWSAMLGHPCTLEITSWASGLRATSHVDGEVTALQIGDLGDWILCSDDAGVKAWRASLPAAINEGIDTIPDLRAEALQLTHELPQAADLMQSNPLLLWLLVDRIKHRDIDKRDAAVLLADKQPNLLKHLGLSGTPQQCRILKKIASARLSRATVEKALTLLGHPQVCSYLGHQQVIDDVTINVLHQYPWIARAKAKKLIPHLSNAQNRLWLRDVVHMLDDIAPVMNCTTIRSLQRLHDRLVGDLNRGALTRHLVRDADGGIATLPPPPLQGTDAIIPLTTQQQVIEEGVELQHCIASYLPRIVRGEYYVYRMTTPARVTIGLKIDRSNTASVDQIHGIRNQPPSGNVTDLVMQWFQRGS